MLLQLTWSRLVWQLQAIIEFLSVNLSDLYNKISLCNISDSCAAKNSKKRQIVQGKGEWICYIYATTRKQNATITFDFPDFQPVPISKPEHLKLTIMMKIEMYYLTRRQRCQFPSWSKKSNIFPCISRVVTFLAYCYNSREAAWFQTTELKNPWKS